MSRAMNEGVYILPEEYQRLKRVAQNVTDKLRQARVRWFMIGYLLGLFLDAVIILSILSWTGRI
jgi:hypothetical protein